MNSTEATETFFAEFQSKDVTLRHLVYLAIKEMSRIADDVIIVTSSLTKDMTGKEDQYRASAIRALCTVIDVCVDWDVQCHQGTLYRDRCMWRLGCTGPVPFRHSECYKCGHVVESLPWQ